MSPTRLYSYYRSSCSWRVRIALALKGVDYEYVAGLGDLDECNGRYGVTPEFPQGTYYYVVTSEFPSIPRMWRGEPSESVRARGAGAGPGGRPPGARPGERGPDGPRPRPDRQRRPDDD